MNELQAWTEFGITGVVIGALLFALGAGFKIFMGAMDKQHNNYKELTIKQHSNYKELTISQRESQSKEFQRLHDQHREERSEVAKDSEKRELRYREERTGWAQDSEKRDLRSDATIREFSQAIKELRDKI